MPLADLKYPGKAPVAATMRPVTLRSLTTLRRSKDYRRFPRAIWVITGSTGKVLVSQSSGIPPNHTLLVTLPGCIAFTIFIFAPG